MKQPLSTLTDLRKAPETPPLVGLVTCVLFAQALLPLQAHARYDTNGLGHWTLVCSWLDGAPGELDEDTQRAPGVVFSSLAAELLAPDTTLGTALPWHSRAATRYPTSRFAAQDQKTAHAIRGPPNSHAN